MTRWTRVGALLVLVFLVGGCNIFESFAPSESASDYISDGREALRDGDYDTAIEAFNNALEDDPNDARAHWGLAKAWVRRSGYTSIRIMTELSKFQEGATGVSWLPFQTDAAGEVNELYVGLQMANEHLKQIYEGGASSIDLDRDAIALDYTGTLAVQGLLIFRDTNGDGLINGNDVDLSVYYENGDFIIGNTNDPNAWLDYYQNNPDEAMSMLNNVGTILTESSTVLADMLGTIAGDADLGVNTDNLGDVITNLLNGLGGYTNPNQ